MARERKRKLGRRARFPVGVRIGLTQGQYDALHQLADREGLDASAMLRSLIIVRARAEGIEIRVAEVQP